MLCMCAANAHMRQPSSTCLTFRNENHTLRPSCALWNSFSIRKKFPIKVTHYVAHSEAHQPGALDCSPNIARWCASLENRSEIVSNALSNPESEWPSCGALSVAVFYQLLPLEPFLLPNSSRILVTFGQTCRCLFKAVRGWTNFRGSWISSSAHFSPPFVKRVMIFRWIAKIFLAFLLGTLPRKALERT